MNRIIATHAELDKLPFGTIVLEIIDGEDHDPHDPYGRGSVLCKGLDGRWLGFGEEETYHWSNVQMPVEVILEVKP